MFKLQIKTGGAAFRSEYAFDEKTGEYALDASGYEVRRILQEVIHALKREQNHGFIMYINGNKVGEWSYE